MDRVLDTVTKRNQFWSTIKDTEKSTYLININDIIGRLKEEIKLAKTTLRDKLVRPEST